MTIKRSESISQAQMGIEEALRNIVVHTLLGALDANDQKRIFVAPCICYVKKIYLVTETTLAAHQSAYRHFRPVNVSTPCYLYDETPAPRSTYYTGIVGDTPWEIPVNENNLLAKGDVIELYMDKTGSPSALAECSVIVVASHVEQDAI